MSSLILILAWDRGGDKPYSEPMVDECTDAYMRHSDPRNPRKGEVCDVNIQFNKILNNLLFKSAIRVLSSSVGVIKVFN